MAGDRDMAVEQALLAAYDHLDTIPGGMRQFDIVMDAEVDAAPIGGLVGAASGPVGVFAVRAMPPSLFNPCDPDMHESSIPRFADL